MKAPPRGAFMLSAVRHFYSGQPMHFYSGVDRGHGWKRIDIIVPDARKYIEGYLDPDWATLNAVGCGEDVPHEVFETKIEALNHMFMQAEHYGGLDFEYMSRLLRRAGFSNIEQAAFGIGKFPEGCIDSPQHASYSLYVEARR